MGAALVAERPASVAVNRIEAIGNAAGDRPPRRSRTRRLTEDERLRLKNVAYDVLILMLKPEARVSPEALRLLFGLSDDTLGPAADATKDPRADAIDDYAPGERHCMFCGWSLRAEETFVISVADPDGKTHIGVSCPLCEAARERRTPARWAQWILGGSEMFDHRL